MTFLRDLVDDAIYRSFTNNSEYREFCDVLDELHELYDEELVLTEEVSRTGTKFSRSVKDAARNTARTTRDVAGAYGMATDAGSSLIKTWWNLMMKGVNLALKALGFTVKTIIKVPDTIMKVTDAVGSIPGRIKTKIRGDIKLYITVDDFRSLYDQNALLHINNFIDACDKLSQGEMWTTMTVADAVEKLKNITNKSFVGKADSQLMSRMRKEFGYYKSIQFTQTTVDLSDPNNVEMYFGTGTINISNVDGNAQNVTYYKGLELLVTSFNNRKNVLMNLQADLATKFKSSQANQTFSDLGTSFQKTIMEAIEMVSRTCAIIGDITRYVYADLETIRKSTVEILNRQHQMDIGDEDKHKKKRDKGIKDVDVNEEPLTAQQFIDEMKSKGYVKVERWQRHGSSKKEIKGIIDKWNDGHVWILKNEVPRGVQILDQ